MDAGSGPTGQVAADAPLTVRERLFQPVDGASLAWFRIAFGGIMLWEVIRYFQHGWIQRYYITPAFHFTYASFEWVRPWPGPGMFLHFYGLGALALALALGVWYRTASVLFFFGFAYVFLLEQARYLNHFYLIALLSFLLMFVPAHRVWSIDAKRHGGERTVPAWSLWLLRLQIGIPYFYAGVAKINHDWLRGEPLREWMAARTGLPLIGPWLTQEGVVYLLAYGALLLDLLMAPALLWKRSRPYAFGAACLFHLLNWQFFTIGIFPFLMIAATTLFFPPEWPRALVARIRPRPTTPETELQPMTGIVGTALPFRIQAAMIPIAVYAGLQVLVPLRHHLYADDVNWTEEGHRFSWRMKLRDKESEATFHAVDRQTGERFEVDWSSYLASWQYEEMSTRPDMILQFSRHVGNDMCRRLGRDIAIRAVVWTSLNSHEPRLLVDPNVDLTTRDRNVRPAEWIRPR